jgi:cyclopropane-fatty-acyl-phospholipid synthase
MDRQEPAVRQVLASTYGAQNTGHWWMNWRLFFLVCSEVWALNRGREYIVSHYLFEKK